MIISPTLPLILLYGRFCDSDPLSPAEIGQYVNSPFCCPHSAMESISLNKCHACIEHVIKRQLRVVSSAISGDQRIYL